MTPADVLSAFRQKGLTVAVAESCTGGLLAADLTEPAGASDVFICGFVTYSNDAKINLLGVPKTTIDDFGAVSEVTAQAMAKGTRARSGADITLSITGIAGPGPSEFKPEGRVCFGLSTDAGTTAHTVEFGAIGRANVRQSSVEHAMAILLDACNSA